MAAINTNKDAAEVVNMIRAGDHIGVRLFIRAGGDPNIRNNMNWTIIHVACIEGQKEIVQTLVDAGASVNACTPDMCTPLHRSCTHGYKEVTEILLGQKAYINAQDKFGNTPLHDAAKNFHTPIVQLLLDNKADKEKTNKKELKFTDMVGQQLMPTIECGDTDVLKSWLDWGLSPNTCGNMSWSILHHASARNQMEVVEMLIDREADVNITDSNRGTPLHAACFYGNVNIAKTLLKGGANINDQDQKGNTPLHSAIAGHHPDVINLLLEKDCDTNIPNKDNQIFTHLVNEFLVAAVQEGKVIHVRSLLKGRADPNTRDSYGSPVLCCAAFKEDLFVVETLLDAGADTNLATLDSFKTPLQLASMRGYLLVLKQLLDAGARVNISDKNQVTPLHEAAKEGHEDIVTVLLGRGAGINQRDCEGNTPLHIAAKWGHPNIVELLLEKGADDRVENNGGLLYSDLALIRAVRTEEVDQVISGLAWGGNPDSKDHKGWTLLHHAVYKMHTNICNLLIECGAKVNLSDNHGRTPLLMAAYRGNREIVELLLEAGAKINTQDKNGFTPLHWAAKEGSADTVQLLLERGSDTNIINIYGQRYKDLLLKHLYFAVRHNDSQKVEWLLKAGADQWAEVEATGVNPRDEAKRRKLYPILRQLVAFDRLQPRPEKCRNIPIEDICRLFNDGSTFDGAENSEEEEYDPDDDAYWKMSNAETIVSAKELFKEESESLWEHWEEKPKVVSAKELQKQEIESFWDNWEEKATPKPQGIPAKEFFKNDEKWWDLEDNENEDPYMFKPEVSAKEFFKEDENWMEEAPEVLSAKDFFKESEDNWWEGTPEITSAKEFFKDSEENWWESEEQDNCNTANNQNEPVISAKELFKEEDEAWWEAVEKPETIPAKEFFKENENWWEQSETDTFEKKISAKEFFKEDNSWWLSNDNEEAETSSALKKSSVCVQFSESNKLNGGNKPKSKLEPDDDTEGYGTELSTVEDWEDANESLISDNSLLFSDSDKGIGKDLFVNGNEDAENILKASDLFKEDSWWENDDEDIQISELTETQEIVDSENSENLCTPDIFDNDDDQEVRDRQDNINDDSENICTPDILMNSEELGDDKENSETVSTPEIDRNSEEQENENSNNYEDNTSTPDIDINNEELENGNHNNNEQNISTPDISNSDEEHDEEECSENSGTPQSCDDNQSQEKESDSSSLSECSSIHSNESKQYAESIENTESENDNDEISSSEENNSDVSVADSNMTENDVDSQQIQNSSLEDKTTSNEEHSISCNESYVSSELESQNLSNSQNDASELESQNITSSQNDGSELESHNITNSQIDESELESQNLTNSQNVANELESQNELNIQQNVNEENVPSIADDKENKIDPSAEFAIKKEVINEVNSSQSFLDNTTDMEKVNSRTYANVVKSQSDIKNANTSLNTQISPINEQVVNEDITLNYDYENREFKASDNIQNFALSDAETKEIIEVNHNSLQTHSIFQNINQESANKINVSTDLKENSLTENFKIQTPNTVEENSTINELTFIPTTSAQLNGKEPQDDSDKFIEKSKTKQEKTGSLNINSNKHPSDKMGDCFARLNASLDKLNDLEFDKDKTNTPKQKTPMFCSNLSNAITNEHQSNNEKKEIAPNTMKVLQINVQTSEPNSTERIKSNLKQDLNISSDLANENGEIREEKKKITQKIKLKKDFKEADIIMSNTLQGLHINGNQDKILSNHNGSEKPVTIVNMAFISDSQNEIESNFLDKKMNQIPPTKTIKDTDIHKKESLLSPNTEELKTDKIDSVFEKKPSSTLQHPIGINDHLKVSHESSKSDNKAEANPNNKKMVDDKTKLSNLEISKESENSLETSSTLSQPEENRINSETASSENLEKGTSDEKESEKNSKIAPENDEFTKLDENDSPNTSSPELSARNSLWRCSTYEAMSLNDYDQLAFLLNKSKSFPSNWRTSHEWKDAFGSKESITESIKSFCEEDISSMNSNKTKATHSKSNSPKNQSQDNLSNNFSSSPLFETKNTKPNVSPENKSSENYTKNNACNDTEKIPLFDIKDNEINNVSPETHKSQNSFNHEYGKNQVQKNVTPKMSQSNIAECCNNHINNSDTSITTPDIQHKTLKSNVVLNNSNEDTQKTEPIMTTKISATEIQHVTEKEPALKNIELEKIKRPIHVIPNSTPSDIKSDIDPDAQGISSPSISYKPPVVPRRGKDLSNQRNVKNKVKESKNSDSISTHTKNISPQIIDESMIASSAQTNSNVSPEESCSHINSNCSNNEPSASKIDKKKKQEEVRKSSSCSIS